MSDAIGWQLRALRLEQGISMRQIADQLGVTFQAVSSWELGRTEMRMSTLLRYCDAIGARIDIGLEEK